jgi:hypothetical protein
LTAALVILLTLAGVAIIGADRTGISPRLLARHIEQRAAGHNAIITRTGGIVASLLRRADRGDAVSISDLPRWAGARREPSASTQTPQADGRELIVTTVAELRAALDAAMPGDRITPVPGTYRLTGQPLVLARPGAADAPIVVRGAHLGEVVIESSLLEGFQVSAPYWSFENLAIRGVCQFHADCEHAFHVVGDGHHFVARNLVVQDFNAQFKVNGAGGKFPDNGVIENSTLADSRVRDTDQPVTPIDIVGANHWRVEGNLIADFAKGGGDRTSYGAYAKGAATGTRFIRNVVLCEHALAGGQGITVGLSFGGGGTEPQACRDGKCIVEHQAGEIADNLIKGCSDAGIYLNRAAKTIVVRNTVLDTAGVDIRYPESVADLAGNLLDGPVRVRDDALLREVDDRTTLPIWLYVGYHPVQSYFVDASRLDLEWREGAPLRARGDEGSIDLCGVRRAARQAYGAFDDFRRCASH